MCVCVLFCASWDPINPPVQGGGGGRCSWKMEPIVLIDEFFKCKASRWGNILRLDWKARWVLKAIGMLVQEIEALEKQTLELKTQLEQVRGVRAATGCLV